MRKNKQAVAIKYDHESKKKQNAPQVVAVGDGIIAEKIINIAKEQGVPVVEDVEVVAKLVRIPLGSEIPPELYAAVAKILAFIYKLDEEKRTARNSGR